MQVIPETPCLISGLGLGSGVLLFGSSSAPWLGSGLLPLEYSAEVLFEHLEELLVAKRSARMFVGTQEFDILLPDHPGEEPTPGWRQFEHQTPLSRLRAIFAC